MKTTKPQKLPIYLALTCIGTALPLHAATTLINGFSSTASGGLSTTSIDGNWHGNLSPWAISSSILTHTASGPTYNGADEGIIGTMLVPGGGSSSTITVSFDYNVAAGNTLYAHLRGFDATAASPSWSINAGAQNGNAWDTSANGTTYNIWDGLTLATSGDTNNGGGDEAMALTGMGTFSTTVDLSSYTINDIADFEWLMLGFAANATNDNPSTISNLSVTVPEPSSTALLGLGALSLMARRRRA